MAFPIWRFMVSYLWRF